MEIIQSGRHPSGVGEPSSTVVAPAVANAIYNAVGVRVRHMPITAEAVLEGLKEESVSDSAPVSRDADRASRRCALEPDRVGREEQLLSPVFVACIL